MLVMNDKGLQHLLSSKFQLSGEGSAAAGPVGRHASAGTDWKLNSELLTYSRSKGAFAGLTLEGAVVEQDADSTVAIYGKDVPFRKVLTGMSLPRLRRRHSCQQLRWPGTRRPHTKPRNKWKTTRNEARVVFWPPSLTWRWGFFISVYVLV